MDILMYNAPTKKKKYGSDDQMNHASDKKQQIERGGHEHIYMRRTPENSNLCVDIQTLLWTLVDSDPAVNTHVSCPEFLSLGIR